MTFHKNFPFGKGVWIWEIKNCLGGDIDAIIKKLKDNDIQYALVKSGDGENTWDFQWTPELINKFHAAGLKIYSWSFVYGLNPIREAQVASWSLNLGGDGHIFDAETQYEQLPDPIKAAEQMLQALRLLNPNDFIAHSPLPIISYHLKFPYATFGKYCDAVMPQVYQGDFKMSSIDAVNWMYNEWSKFEPTFPEDSRKPIIPVAQAYDNHELTPAYLLAPDDITAFVGISSAYKSVNFYEFAHILRNECWDAIRIAKVTPPTDEDLGRVISTNQAQPQNSTNTVTPLTIEAGKEYLQGQIPDELFNITDGRVITNNDQQYIGHVNTNGTRSFTVFMPPSNPDISSTQPTTTTAETAQPTTSTTAPDNVTVNTDKLPTDTEVLTTKELPVPSTIKITKNVESPGGVQMKVIPHKPHIEYVIEFFQWLISKFRKGVQTT